MGERASDEELVKRIQSGDKTAFDVLVRKYQHKIVNLVFRYVHDHSIAMDLAQESFIKAWRGLATFRGESAFYTWLYRIAINTAKNHLVAEGRRPQGIGVDAQDAEQTMGDAMPSDIATPERELLGEEIHGIVQRAIDNLPEDLRTAIVLREIENLSYEEIAEAMECPIGTVRSRIFRAREAINQELKPLL